MMNLSRFDNSGFDRGASVLKEWLWRLVQGFFFQPLWHMPSGIRVFWLRVFGARIGRAAVVRAGVNISFPWRLEMGDHVWLGEEVMILSLGKVSIGSHCCISQRAFLCTGSHDHRSPGFDLIVRGITIEAGSWIGAQAWVGPGVKVGSGSVVAAGAVVTHDVAPGRLIVGNPAEDKGASGTHGENSTP
jgi:putative colanic acid biosynthesis acetyltransferase WcaF